MPTTNTATYNPVGNTPNVTPKNFFTGVPGISQSTARFPQYADLANHVAQQNAELASNANQNQNQPPLDRMQQLEADYKSGKIPFSQLFEQYQLPSRNPALSGIVAGGLSDTAAVDKSTGLPDFNALKDQFGSANSEMNTRYNQFQAGNDISGYAAGQRAADAAAAGLTNVYANTARGQLGEAADVTSRYRTEGLGALDAYKQNASDFYNKDIPASIANAIKESQNYTSRYAMSRGGRMGSDVASIAGASAVRAALPFQLQGRQYMGEALSRYQPFYGDVASRDYNRIAGLNMPTEANIYNQRTGDVLRGKATEQQIQSLDMMVKERGLNAAIQNLRNQGIAPGMVNDLIRQWQQLKSGTLGLAGQGAGLEQQFGAERGYNYLPGSGPVAQPQYYGLPQPNFPNNGPGRYQNQPVAPTAANNVPQSRYGDVSQGAPQYLSPQEQNIQRVLGYSQQHPDAGQYGGQYPGASFGTGAYRVGDTTNIPPRPPIYNPVDQWPDYNY